MKILLLDTTGQDCGAALWEDHILLERRESLGRGHAERLGPMVQALLAEAGWSPHVLDRIGVTIGPGSFAGTRVGVAFARGLGLSARAQVIGISNLKLMALAVDPKRDARVRVLHDAKRGDVIVQLYQNGTEIGPPERFTLDQTKNLIVGDDHPAAFINVGSAAPLLGLKDEASQIDYNQMGQCIAEAGADAPRPIPFYARPPDAKLPGGQALAEG